MPRLRQVPRAEVTDPLVASVYQALFGDRDPVAEPGTATGTPGHWWTVLALAPHVLEHFVQCSRMYMGPKLSLDPMLRELGQMRAGWLNGCQFVYSQHCKMARGVGLADEQIDAIKAWQVADCFDERQRTVLAYVDCLVSQRGRVPDAVFAKLKSFLSDPEIVELTYVTCCYDGYSVLTRALRLEYDDRDDPVVEVAAPDAYDGADFMGGRR
ncbi:carboxymuconolactone decarboxylase family protein [Phenylobacterium sp.]|uniref:carboxymuconolactone decarboxylase family protein n=1 Tax=Phenylobacterium sp. TaxID=1871053 RepID=UPI0025CDC2AD|nr:carboxymuconolactone decarboxylase family protein [Phenylobacterium sp.]